MSWLCCQGQLTHNTITTVPLDWGQGQRGDYYESYSHYPLHTEIEAVGFRGSTFGSKLSPFLKSNFLNKSMNKYIVFIFGHQIQSEAHIPVYKKLDKVHSSFRKQTFFNILSYWNYLFLITTNVNTHNS